MKRKFLSISLIGFVTACGGGGDSSPSASPDSEVIVDSATQDVGQTTGNTASATMLTSTGLSVTIPPNVTSSATMMSEVSVPSDFNYNGVDIQNLSVDIRGYSLAKGYVSIYGAFEQNADGPYSADYNSRITSATVEAGLADLSYPLADSQYYMLAEVYFYDGSTPIQTRINNQQTSWIW